MRIVCLLLAGTLLLVRAGGAGVGDAHRTGPPATREVMEFFTLGESHYGERDVKEAARAFTGWSIDADDGTFVLRRFQHDYGEKTVLGRTGKLDDTRSARCAAGLVALRAALQELNRWDSTLVMTYAEFGRRPRENQSGGTDHGTANAHFVLGGAVGGGLYGAAPQQGRLDNAGNPGFAIDFRSVYATALERWWGLPSQAILNGRFPLVSGVLA